MWWRSVGLKAFHDQWRATVGFAVLMALYAGLLLAIFPSISSIVQLKDIFDKLPESMRALFAPGGVDITTPEGYLATEFYSIIGPLLFFGYTIAIGGSATAAEEERGTIDMVLALPVRRWRLVLEKFVSMVIGASILGVALLVGVALGAAVAGLTVRFDGFIAVTAGSVLLALLFGALAMWIGALTGRRTTSIGVAFGLAIASYFVYSFSSLVEVLKPLRPLSPFTYYIGDDPLTKGVQANDLAVLGVTTLVFLVLALLSFQRRDLRV